MARKLSETVQLKLRFSEELRRKLEKAAERNGQSMNAEIIARLDGSFTRQEARQDIERAVELAVINILQRTQAVFGTVIDPDHRVAGMTAAEFTKELLEQTGKDEKKEKGK